MYKNTTACIKRARRCNEFAVSNRFLKIFVRCNLQKTELSLFNYTVTATLLSVKMCKNSTACEKSARRCNIFAVCKRFLKIIGLCNLQKELRLFNCTVTETLLSVKIYKNATAFIKSARRCNVFAVSNRFLKIFA